MHLSELVAAVAQIRAATKKTEKVGLLADVLRRTAQEESELAALYLTGSFPQGKIGIGWSAIQRAMAEGPPSGEPVTLRDVDATLTLLAQEQGAGSTERKVAELSRLFHRATAEERRFLSQLFVGEIRQGALEGLVIEAIAKAAALPLADIRQAAMFAGHIGAVARAALQEGAPGLARFSLRLFTPVAPMLATSVEDVEEALHRLDRAGLEYKLDGARIQVHKGGEDVQIFTRQLQEVTGRLPELVDWARGLPVREAVLDGEALALRPDGRPQPFQMTMRRLGRIKDVQTLRHEIPLSPFMFDVLYVDGQSLLANPYEDRMKVLPAIASSTAVPRLVSADPEESRRFFAQALAAGHEGVMAKSLHAPYSAGQRGFHWLKLKAATTLDLVVLAAEWGNGRREGWLSNLHLGARDPATGQFIMLGKTFKGLTDEMLRWQTEKLLALETHREGHIIHVLPAMVVEIAFSDIQQSPRYPAGLALRFARVKRYRPDKSPEHADTIQTVTGLFARQRA